MSVRSSGLRKMRDKRTMKEDLLLPAALSPPAVQGRTGVPRPWDSHLPDSHLQRKAWGQCGHNWPAHPLWRWDPLAFFHFPELITVAWDSALSQRPFWYWLLTLFNSVSRLWVCTWLPKGPVWRTGQQAQTQRSTLPVVHTAFGALHRDPLLAQA